jgi:hypothetical protein
MASVCGQAGVSYIVALFFRFRNANLLFASLAGSRCVYKSCNAALVCSPVFDMKAYATVENVQNPDMRRYR